jgi:hypothetical protein
MVRRSALLLALGFVAASALLLGASVGPAAADGSGPVIAGTFAGRLVVTHSDAGMGNLATKPGARTFSFGSSCTTSSCMLRLSGANGASTQKLTPAGGGYSWSGSSKLNCYDRGTGALTLKNGATYHYAVHIRPSATTTVGGTTYATALAGSYHASITASAAARAQHCTSDVDGKYSAAESGRYTLRLVPLATPPPLTQSAPLGLAPAATRVTTSTISGFHLPQSKRQSASAAAVAAGLRSSVPGALVEPSDALKSLGSRLPQDLLLVAVLGLLIVFPAQLFNSTYEENHERIDVALARLRFWRRRPSVSTATVGAIPAQPPDETIVEPAPASRVRRLAVFAGCLVVGTLLAGFLDPKFGTTTASYALLTGVFVSVLVTVLVVVLAGRLHRSVTHHESDWYLEAIPSALLVAVVCVLVSRLTHFEPGYLYGVLGGAVFVAALERRDEGRAEVTVSVVVLVLALGSWIAFEPVSHAATKAGAGYPVLALDSLLASLFIGSLEGMLFGLVPLRFLPGARIKNWSWAAWAVLAAVVAYVFVHVLLMPESGYLGRSTSASVTTTIALFAAFAVVSVLFWAYFRWRPTPEETGAEAADDTAAVPVVVPDTPAALTGPAAPTTDGPPRVPVDSQGDVVDGTGPRVPRQQGSSTGEGS